MKRISRIIYTLITLVLLVSPAFSRGFSGDSEPQPDKALNLKRTNNLIEKVEKYLRDNDTYVGILARRGAGDPETGVSDTDGLDLSGMAHCGFVIRNGFAKDSEYITFNLVRIKGGRKIGNQEFDISELRAWTLPHFFIGAFEKDAIVFLPPKGVQLQLWNTLRAHGSLKIEAKQRIVKSTAGASGDSKTVALTDQIITNGAFAMLHNPEYNLLSDFVEPSTQNCNEHLLLTYIGFRDHWNPMQAGFNLHNMDKDARSNFLNTTTTSVKANFYPRQMILSRTKSTFAFIQNIRFGESYRKAPTFLGLKLKKERFNVVSVDSFCDAANQPFLNWADFKVFRENYNAVTGWRIEDWHRDYVKVNRFTGAKNSYKIM